MPRNTADLLVDAGGPKNKMGNKMIRAEAARSTDLRRTCQIRLGPDDHDGRSMRPLRVYSDLSV